MGLYLTFLSDKNLLNDPVYKPFCYGSFVVLFALIDYKNFCFYEDFFRKTVKQHTNSEIKKRGNKQWTFL